MHPLNGALSGPYVPVLVTRGVLASPSTAPGLGVCEWSPDGLKDESVSLIPNTDEILKFVKKKNELIGLHLVDTQPRSWRRPWLWSHIGTLMRRLAAEHRSGLLFPSLCPSGTILLTPYSMVWDWRV